MRDGTTALLPVGNCFFGKRNLNMEEIGSIWGDREHGCTVQVMENDEGRTRFVVGSGLGGYDTTLDVRHDQTGARMGRMTQFGEVRIQNGKVISKMVLKGREIPKAAPVLVYK